MPMTSSPVPPRAPLLPLAPLPRADSRRHRILLVDDLEDLSQAAREILEEAGYAVQVAHDAVSAQALVETQEPFDLVFTDLVMPGGNGLELAEALRQKQPHLRVLFTTGYTRHVLAKSREMQRQYRVLAKPYDREALLREVRLALGQSASPNQFL